REAQPVDERSGRAYAARLAAVPGFDVGDRLDTRAEPEQAGTEHAVQAVVEAHRRDRRDRNAVLDPQRGEARHSGRTASLTVGPVQVPEIRDRDAGAERGMQRRRLQAARTHARRTRTLIVGCAVA